MPQLLAWLRMLLVLAPAVATALLADIPTYSVYVASVLAGLLLIRLGALKPAWLPLLLPVELIGFGLLAYTYGGLLYCAVYSGLLAGASQVKRGPAQALIVLLSLAALLAATDNQSSDVRMAALLFWFATAALLAAYVAAERRLEQAKGELEAMAGRRERLEASRRQTIDYARQVERHAQAEERSRIARELHDDLGHRMIRLKMMSEAALQLFERDPAKARAIAEQIRDQLQDSMDNMRRTVRKLRPPEADPAREYALDRLIEDAARDLGLAVRLTMTGRPEPLYPSLEYVLYRNAQEAITNAVRHGRATSVSIELAYLPGEIRMAIANDGALPDGRIRHGLGLGGMEERLRLLGGRLEIELAGSFRIVSAVPIHGNAAEGG